VQGGFYCQNAVWESCSERALAHYQRAGWPTTSSVQGLASALYYGPRPVSDAIARCEALLEHEVTDRGGEANVRVWLGGLEAFQGRFDIAREAVALARQTFDELGQPVSAAVLCDYLSAATETLAGNVALAEQHLRASCNVFQERGEWAYLSNHAAGLADALFAQERYSEADEWSLLAKQHAASDDLSAQFTWRSIRAKLLAHTGELAEAGELAREAVELVDRTDALNQRANVRLDRAYVLQVAQQADAAAAVASEAANMYEQKGNIVSARVALATIERLATV